MSALPNRIRQQAELANQLAAKAKSGTLSFEDINSTTPAPTAPQAQQPMPSGFQPQPAGPGVPGLGTPGFQPQAPTAPNAQAPAAPNAPAPADDQAEHRYKVLQGKYNAEVPRLQAQNKELSERFSAMQNQLSATQALLAGMGQQPQAPHLAQRPAQASLVTPKEVTEFGADLYDFVKRAAQEVVAPQVHSLEERFRPIAQAVQQMAPMVQQTQENQQRTSADEHSKGSGMVWMMRPQLGEGQRVSRVSSMARRRGPLCRGETWCYACSSVRKWRRHPSRQFLYRLHERICSCGSE